MSVHTCQCRCVPHVEDHCRNGEPDSPPEVIEKAAEAVPLYLMVNGRDTQRRVAEAVLAAVTDDLIAKGYRDALSREPASIRIENPEAILPMIHKERIEGARQVLAEAGLLADHAYCNERVDRADQRTDAARAELADAERRAIEMEARYRGAKLRAEVIEQRGAVAALRAAADRLDEMDEPWPDRPRLHQDHAEWLRDRADRIEGEDRG